MTPSLCAWLDELDLARYLPLFEQHCVDLISLPLLAESDLAELGIPLGHRKRLMKAIAEMGGDAPSPPVAARSGEPPAAIPDSVAPPSTANPPPPAAPAGPRAERRQLTVMFCDLVGSTRLAQALDPESLRDLMQAYQQACAGVVEKYAGHVAQYLGDGVLVYFGWPSAHEDDAERAVHAGLEIVDAVKGIATPGLPVPLAVRIGIATGPVVVGETGAGDAAIPKAAVGETPNLAARLQALARPDQILLAPSTQRLLGSVFTLVELGEQTVKDIAEPLRLYRVVGVSEISGHYDATGAVPDAGTSRLSPCVGREAELGLLLSRWEQACAREGQLVLLSGEPGIGKTRLTQALRERIAATPHVRLRYQCSPHHSASALYPTITHLRHAAGFERDDPPDVKLDKLEANLAIDADEIPTVAPLFAALLSLPIDRYPARMLSPQKQKELTLVALADQVMRLAARNPVLLLVEDAQWIDPTSVELLGLLVERIRDQALLLLITYRPDFVPPWLGHSHVTTFNLSRLPRRQGAEIVLEVTGGKALPDEVLARILDRTDGVPLFVEELTTTILEAGFLTDAGTHYTLDGPLPPLAIPSTLQDSLMARLDRLGPAKEVAQMAACIGREFGYELLAAVCAPGDTDLRRTLQQFVDSGLVFVRGTPPEALYSFRHALVQQAAYDSLLIKRRQQIHSRIAGALVSRFPETVSAHPELLARHHSDAGEIDAALPQWLAGARHAAVQSRHREALQHMAAGLAIVERAAEGQRVDMEVALLITGASCHFALSGYGCAPADDLIARIEGKLDRVADPAVQDSALWAIGVQAWVKADFAKARTTFERLVAIAEASADPDRLVIAYQCLGALLMPLAEFEHALRLLEYVVAHYDLARHRRFLFATGQDAKVTACAWLGLINSYCGFPDQARRYVRDAIAHANAIAHLPSLAMALANGARALVIIGDHEEALRLGRQTIELCETQRLAFWMGWALTAEGLALLWQGEPARAAERLAVSLKAMKAIGPGYGEGQTRALRAAALAQAGLPAEARSEADAARARGHGQGELLPVITSMYAYGIVELFDLEADGSQAERWFLDCIAMSGEVGERMYQLRSATALAGLWRRQGKVREALALLAPLHGWFTEGFDCGVVKEAAALLTELEKAEP